MLLTRDEFLDQTFHNKRVLVFNAIKEYRGKVKNQTIADMLNERNIPTISGESVFDRPWKDIEVSKFFVAMGGERLRPYKKQKRRKNKGFVKRVTKPQSVNEKQTNMSDKKIKLLNSVLDSKNIDSTQKVLALKTLIALDI